MEEMVFVIEDEGTRAETVSQIRSMGFAARDFGTAEAYLAAAGLSRRGCLVLDYRLPGMNGIELLQARRHAGLNHPVIFLTAHATIGLAVRAMQMGATTFLERPADEHQLWDAIRHALERSRQEFEADREFQELRLRFEALTSQESQILQMMMDGQTNREIARILDISTRTVENRRQNISRKTQTRHLPDLVRTTVRYQEFVAKQRDAASGPSTGSWIPHGPHQGPNSPLSALSNTPSYESR